MWVDFSLSGAMVTYRAAANHRRGEERRGDKRGGEKRKRGEKEWKKQERKGKERGCEGFCGFHKSHI